jgi:hypothetical protein
MKTKALYHYNREFIQKALELSDMDYCTMQYEKGLEYLSMLCLGGDNSRPYKVLSTSRAFWQWWINQWNLEDSRALLQTGADVKMIRTHFYRSAGYANSHLNALLENDRSRIKIFPNDDVIFLARKEAERVA